MSTEPTPTFADWVKQQRQARGWSEYELARRCARHRSWVNHLESGKRKWFPPPSDVRALADAFELPVTDVLIGAGYLTPDDLRGET